MSATMQVHSHHSHHQSKYCTVHYCQYPLQITHDTKHYTTYSQHTKHYTTTAHKALHYYHYYYQ